jgi:hypothetical protein
MAQGLLRRLTFSNVCSFLALTIALGTGTAYAASTVGSSDIINKSIRSVDIKNGQVASSDIRDATIKAPDLAPGAVTGAKVLDESLTSADLATSSVGATEIADDSLTTADIAGADVNGAGISVPTGYVPNGRCRQLDASVGGAKTGEAVIFSVKAAIQDGIVIYGQRVPSDGHVMFDVCNFSGATQVAIDDLPVRVITFG